MTPFKFTQEMFDKSTLSSYLAADIANARLALWLKDAVKVLQLKSNVNAWFKDDGGYQEQYIEKTALLIDIKEVEKKCEHHALTYTRVGTIMPDTAECHYCGAKLKATWSEA